MYGMIFKPLNLEAGVKYPTVLFTYGGPHAQVYIELMTIAVHNSTKTCLELNMFKRNMFPVNMPVINCIFHIICPFQTHCTCLVLLLCSCTEHVSNPYNYTCCYIHSVV